jgi:hypothetical protein
MSPTIIRNMIIKNLGSKIVPLVVYNEKGPKGNQNQISPRMMHPKYKDTIIEEIPK